MGHPAQHPDPGALARSGVFFWLTSKMSTREDFVDAGRAVRSRITTPDQCSGRGRFIHTVSASRTQSLALISASFSRNCWQYLAPSNCHARTTLTSPALRYLLHLAAVVDTVGLDELFPGLQHLAELTVGVAAVAVVVVQRIA